MEEEEVSHATKAQKSPGPIRLLETMGKILERAIFNKQRQCGFRRFQWNSNGRASGSGGEVVGECCTVMTLDVRSAFDSAKDSSVKGTHP